MTNAQETPDTGTPHRDTEARTRTVGAMHRQPLSANATRAEHYSAATGLPMEAHRRGDLPIEPVRAAEGLDLVADLDRGVDGRGRGAGENRAVIEEHGCCPVMFIVGEPVGDQ